MDRNSATQEIKSRWKEFYPADDKGRGKGIVCPLCGSGSGPNGSGITEMPRSSNHFLKCWNGGCDFERGGSIIDLYMKHHKIESFSQAVDEMAAELGIVIDAPAGRPAPGSKPRKGLSFSGQASAPASASTEAADPAPAAVSDPGQAAADYTQYYEDCFDRMLCNLDCLDYLKGRGFTVEEALLLGEKYHYGVDFEWISPTLLRKLKATGNPWRPQPTPRMIFPTSPTHYVARDIRPDAEIPDDQKRYVKMNEGSPGIMNLSVALSSDADNIFVTEGCMDMLSVEACGQVAISLNSTSNAEKLLKRLEADPPRATLILCLDNDAAGRKTSTKLRDGLRRLNISCIEADISGNYPDPNDHFKADRSGFKAAIERAITDTAARPDSTVTYLDCQMAGEIERFKQAGIRKTGFSNIDAKITGAYPGLYVLAAISSLGKTTLALQMADNFAVSGLDVLFFSMEQSRFEMVSKSIARITAMRDMRTAVNALAIRNGVLPAQVTDAIGEYKRITGGRVSIIEGNFNCDLAHISDYIRQYIARTNTRPIVFIDYLQILQPAADGRSKGSKKDEIDMAIIELKRLSRELDLTVIVISSLNRANYMTPFAFESLKESGGIEYTADVIWGLQLQCLDEDLFDKEGNLKAKRNRINTAKEENPRKIKFICLKNRYGTSHYECNFMYYPEYDLFVPAADTPNQQNRRRT